MSEITKLKKALTPFVKAALRGLDAERAVCLSVDRHGDLRHKSKIAIYVAQSQVSWTDWQMLLFTASEFFKNEAEK